MLIWLMSMLLIIPMIMMLLNMLISKKEWLDYEKISSFECGFDNLSSARLPFAINFYLIGILFVIFDVEVIYLFSSIELSLYMNFFDWVYFLLFFFLILFLGLEFEKNEGTLKWIF